MLDPGLPGNRLWTERSPPSTMSVCCALPSRRGPRRLRHAEDFLLTAQQCVNQLSDAVTKHLENQLRGGKIYFDSFRDFSPYLAGSTTVP
jgi:hypothetical protein